MEQSINHKKSYKGTAGSEAAICVQTCGFYLLVMTHIGSDLAENYIKTPNNSTLRASAVWLFNGHHVNHIKWTWRINAYLTDLWKKEIKLILYIQKL